MHTKKQKQKMPYKQIDFSGLSQRIADSKMEPVHSFANNFDHPILEADPELVSERQEQKGFQFDLKISPRFATILGVIGIGVLGLGIVSSLPNGTSSAAEPIDTTNLETAITNLREENTELSERNQELIQELRVFKQEELRSAPQVTETSEDETTTEQTTDETDELPEDTETSPLLFQ